MVIQRYCKYVQEKGYFQFFKIDIHERKFHTNEMQILHLCAVVHELV